MDAIIFIVDSLLTLAVYAFLLRLLLQWSRADFRNPLAQAVMKLTDWLVMPARKVLPPIGRVDTASVVAFLLAQLAATGVVFVMSTGIVMPAGALLWSALRAATFTVINFYTFAIIVFALLSFVAPGTYSPAVGLLNSLCDPLLRPVRQVLPVVGGLDFSPLFVIIALQALKILLR